MDFGAINIPINNLTTKKSIKILRKTLLSKVNISEKAATLLALFSSSSAGAACKINKYEKQKLRKANGK